MEKKEVVCAGKVSPLRQRFIDDMTLAGLCAGTRKSYIGVVSALQNHAGYRPDRLSEAYVRRYLLYLREEKKVAKGTFQSIYCGLKFFYYRTLNLDWSLFTKKKFVFPTRSVFRWFFPPRIAAV